MPERVRAVLTDAGGPAGTFQDPGDAATRQPPGPTPRGSIQRDKEWRRSARCWLDARLHRQEWLALLTAEDIATYVFMCLVANPQGVSWYRRDRIQQALGCSEDALWGALRRLYALDLVAYRPFGPHASDGFHQVLSLPEQGPPEVMPWLDDDQDQ